MDRSGTGIVPQKFQTPHTTVPKYGRCEPESEYLLFWLSGHPTTSTEYTYNQLEDQTEAHTIAQLSQIMLQESSPFDLNRDKLPGQIESISEVDQNLGIPMMSVHTKKRVRVGKPFEYGGSVSSSEELRRPAEIQKVLDVDYKPSQEPNQPSDAMRMFFATALLELLDDAAMNTLKDLPEGYHRSHAIWLTSSLPLTIMAKEISDPDDRDTTIASFERESGDEFTLMSRKTPAGEYPHETYSKDVLWIKRWIEDWRDMLYINPQEMRLFINKKEVRFYVSKKVAKCYDGKWYFYRPLDKKQLSTWELLPKRVRDGEEDDWKEEVGKRKKRLRV